MKKINFLSLFLLIWLPSQVIAEKLRLTIHPYLTAQELMTKFMPLVDYLTVETGLDIELMISADYEQHVEQLGKNQIDVAYVGPFLYVKLIRDYGEKPLLARLEINGRPTFRGAIVTGQSREKIGQLSHLIGKRFAFGSKESTMGYLVPYYLLKQEGIDLEQLAYYEFLGSHDNVAMSVLMGEFDAGAVMEDIFYKYQEKGLNLLALTPEISEHLFATRSDLPQEQIEKLRQALLSILQHPDSKTVLAAIKSNLTNFVPVTDSDYDSLRIIMNHMEQ
ncbi:phosphate/phosphite/phosphonate ABC transporter substrate-binding protein [Thioflexithrix psekupsensis]|uniref:Phosphonate ABC transporter substrate-binding protein n=1 Tax=Thioflexithrix psekupsensis TaxID=1570016 RepID=A0A251X705_9GAMM|nr:phosphate/phosphite/phosphonate ABC transporter substrate-binding protein [Thioflexithrix psekupsensis]OUD12828.1 hypothetical protein TPSD3_12505 [Thioflexithrix psekupsensis]OUD16052.1 hypothetical protein TPSD3_01210 [Thioflexithrix psekupsensis]